MESKMPNLNLSLPDIIAAATKVPGVRVNRADFLRTQFRAETPEMLDKIVAQGPVEAQCDRETLRKLAQKLISERTLLSTSVSFAAGMPGGLAMGATISADLF